jgi:hypothetical protein
LGVLSVLGVLRFVKKKKKKKNRKRKAMDRDQSLQENQFSEACHLNVVTLGSERQFL